MKPLREPTPPAWAEQALRRPDILLLDQMQCEMKATTTALSLVGKNPQITGLVVPLLEVAREEMAHYQLIHALVVRRGYRPEPVMPSPYVVEMRRRAALGPQRPLLDRFLVAALVEARSCERFRLLAAVATDGELRELYASLVGAEARHFGLYVDLAKAEYPERMAERRLAELSAIESAVMSELEPSSVLHSGWCGLAPVTA